MKTDIQQARAAITTFRDAARQGVEIGFRQRDPLVALLHDALDEFEQTDKQVATLTAALRRYGSHEQDCKVVVHPRSRMTAPWIVTPELRAATPELWGKYVCTCGLDAVLRAASEGP